MASRERDDAMAGLLKRTLAGKAGAGNDCPGPDVLAAYFERSLDAGETAHVELHLSECARCREQLGALGRAEAEAPVASAVAPAAGAPRKAPRRSWMWDWRWLAPVAAVLVIAAVWATRRPELTRVADRERASATVATSPSAQPPFQNADRKAAQYDKQQASSRLMAPAPSTPPLTRQASPATGSGTGFGTGVPATTAENSRSANTAVPKPASPEELSKKAAEQQSSADAATNPPSPTATSESVTVESAVPAVAGASIAPSPAPQPNANRVIGGAVGGVSGAARAKVQTSKEKEAPALVSTFGARDEIVTANQAGELLPAHIIPTPDVKILWRIASGGFIERSEDGGATWNGTLPSPNAHFVAGSAPSAKVCWLVGDDGIILLTRDAVNWQTIPPPVREDFVAVSARNRSSATVTTADGRKFTTTNQGENWTPAK